MKRDPLPAHVMATRLIPNVSPDMAKELNLQPHEKSLAIITYVQKLAEPNPAVRRVRLRGLAPLIRYYCEQDRRIYDGATLMNAGYVLPEMHGDFDSVRLVFRCV